VCGVAGLTSFTGCIDMRLARRLGTCLQHRGPDDQGYLTVAGKTVSATRDWGCSTVRADAALVHRRLAIIDLAETGWQPMGTPDGRYFLIYNGEIYNHVELRQELERLGCHFRSTSDTEVLLQVYATWGVAGFGRLVGMFAVAILDVAHRTLLLARDFFGIKPLYYARWRDGFAFASQLRPLLELPGVERNADPQRVYAYLRHGLSDHGGGSLVRGIRQLPAAHWLELSLDSESLGEPVRYWDLDLTAKADISRPEASRRLRDLFMHSVELHLRSDVPVGIALSGGIDSSAITMAVRQLRGRTQQLHTFSYTAEENSFDEEPWVDLVGTAAHAVVHKVHPRREDLAQDIDRLLAAHDEPCSNTSIYAQYRLYETARRVGVKVVLDGQGADELLGGYRNFLVVRLVSLLRRGDWAAANTFLQHASSLPGMSKRWLIVRVMSCFVPMRLHPLALTLADRHPMPGWLNSRWFAAHQVHPGTPFWSSAQQTLREMLYRSLSELSLPRLLRYADRNAMAFSIENRVPFLTPALASFVLSLPDEYLIGPDGTGKAIFRQAMRGIVPEAILARRDKIGFETPERAWLLPLQPWAERLMTQEAARSIQAIDLDGLRREMSMRLSGRKKLSALDSPVWRCLDLLQWASRFGVTFD
jgi:asparagine synthase (glutamine-hydrolysing)